MKKWYKIIFWRPDMGARKIDNADGYLIFPDRRGDSYFDNIVFYSQKDGRIATFKKGLIRAIMEIVEFDIH